jgi:hypothetical protein
MLRAPSICPPTSPSSLRSPWLGQSIPHYASPSCLTGLAHQADLEGGQAGTHSRRPGAGVNLSRKPPGTPRHRSSTSRRAKPGRCHHQGLLGSFQAFGIIIFIIPSRHHSNTLPDMSKYYMDFFHQESNPPDWSY